MAALLEQEATAYPELRRGEIIEGVVVGTDRDGILVDIGAKSEGVVPPHEMHCLQPQGSASLRPGDKVLVFVVQPESPEGQIILSLDRARGERGWRILQEHMDHNQAFEAYVTGSNKGGLLVNVEGVNAFVPLSQIVAGPDRSSPEATQKALSEWVGKSINVKVIELNRRRNRAILSERAAVQEKRAAEKERLLQELQEGDIRVGRITSVRDFGIFVDIGGADGLVHLSEMSWERTSKSPHEMFKVGDEIHVYILKVDNESKKIALSLRRAQPERWEEIVARYREGQIVPGQVTKLAPFGAFVRLEGPIEGLIHISELVDHRINHPKEVVEEGDVLPVKIVRIEYDRHRLGLSLRQARDRAEEDGWSFSADGRVLSAPQSVLERLGVTATSTSAESAQAAAEAEPQEQETPLQTEVEAATSDLDEIAPIPSTAPAPEASAPAPVAEPPEAAEIATPAAESTAPEGPEAQVSTTEDPEPLAQGPTADTDEPVSTPPKIDALAAEIATPAAESTAPEGPEAQVSTTEDPQPLAQGPTAYTPEPVSTPPKIDALAAEIATPAAESTAPETKIPPIVNETPQDTPVTQEPSDALNTSDES